MAKHLQIVISKNKNVKKGRDQGRKGEAPRPHEVAHEPHEAPPSPPKGMYNTQWGMESHSGITGIAAPIHGDHPSIEK